MEEAPNASPDLEGRACTLSEVILYTPNAVFGDSQISADKKRLLVYHSLNSMVSLLKLVTWGRSERDGKETSGFIYWEQQS